MGLEEARPKETLNIKVVEDFMNSLKRVEHRTLISDKEMMKR
jgi:hypothetical protein